MANNDQKQLDQVITLRERLRAKEARLSQRLAEVRNQLEAVTITMGLLNRGQETDLEEALPAVSIEQVRGMKQLEALIYIARHNNNRVRIVDAKKLLGKAGVMKVSKNSYGILYTVITRSEKFKRCGPGEYELLQPNSSALQLLAAN
jgi:hypothetical protein